MVSTLCHQPLRGLIRSLSAVLPCNRSRVHLTSLAVNGLPSCHLTPERSLKLRLLPSSFHDQLSARSGTIVSRLFCALCWSYMTRLFMTPMTGIRVEKVASSWIDMLAG